jgi:hypothetical protein
MTLFWAVVHSVTLRHVWGQVVEQYEVECYMCGARRPGDEWWGK